MQELNYLTMLTALRKCTEIGGLRVGIFTSTQKRSLDVFDEAIKSMDKEERELKSRSWRSSTGTFIEFKNGSSIKVLSANKNARGHAFHKVLYEGGISNEILNCVILPTEKLRSPQF